MTKKLVEIKNLFFFLIVIYLILNYNRLFFETFNLEWYFIEFAKNLQNRDYYFNYSYFKTNQANNGFYPFILSIISFFSANIYEQIYIFRITNIIGVLLAFYVYLNFSLLKKESIYFVCLLFLLSPIANVYIFRIYPDILSVVFCYISFFFLLEPNKKKIFISSLLFSLAFLLKPIAAVITPLFLFLFLRNNYIKKNILFISFLFIFMTIAIYLVATFLDRSFILSKYYQETYLKFNLLNSLSSFVNYINYLMLLIFPFSLILGFKFIYFAKSKIKIAILTLCLIILFFLFINNDSGEMNYGYINKFISNNYLTKTLLIINSIFSILFIFSIYLSDKKHHKILLSIIIFILLLLSVLVFRPAQRYLLYCLPILYYLINDIFKKNSNKNFYYMLYFLCFGIINFGQQIYQKKTEIIFNEFKNYVISKNISSTTSPGPSWHSIGYIFKIYIKDVVYKKNNNLEKFKYSIDNCNHLNANKKIIFRRDLKIYNLKIDKFCLTKR